MNQVSAIPVRRPLGAPDPGRLTRTVPREFVHRAAVAEVLLVDWRAVGPSCFSLTAQWPRGHRFYTAVAGRWHDPMLAAETVRQAGLLISHAEFDVPLDHVFVMSELSCACEPQAMLTGHRPAELELLLTCEDVRMRGGKLAGMRYEVDMLRDGELAARGRALFTCVSPSAYRRLRADRWGYEPAGQLGAPPLPAEAPELVGRTSVHDVVVTPRENGSRGLRVDLGHPTMFDHPVDHVPGMVVMEAARQSALAELHPLEVLPTGFDARFLRYVEHDVPCTVSSRLDPTGNGAELLVQLAFRQSGAIVFECSVAATPVG